MTRHSELERELRTRVLPVVQTLHRRIRAGVVNFNRPTTGAAGDMPFGGLGATGLQRA